MAIKLFHAGQAGAPTLTGQAGALVTVLDAILVNGYNSVSISSLTRSAGLAMATTAEAHGFKSGDSALISGADQAGYNVEAVVSVIDETHFSYSVAGEPETVASGSIAVKRAPAGFDKVFAATNKAAYRARKGLRPFLQIIDDSTTPGAGREAKTRGYLAMSDVDTGGEPFPTDTQYKNGLMTYKSGSIDATARPWVLITDGKTIYFQACMDQSPPSRQASGGYLWWLGFGEIIPSRPNDPFAAFLAACHASNMQTNGGHGSNHNGMFVAANRTANPNSGSCYIVRSYTQTVGAVVMNQCGHGWDQNALGSLAIFNYPHPTDNAFMMTPLQCMQGGVMRGKMPGVFEPLQGRCLGQFDTVQNVDGYPGRTFMALCGQNCSGYSTTGMLMFDITGNENGEWD